MTQFSTLIRLTNLYIILFVCTIQIHGATIPTDQKNALTFQWYDVVPNKVEITTNNKKSHLVEYSTQYKKSKAVNILQGTNFVTEFPDSISRMQSSSFVDTVFYSYQKHHNLIIRPDDVWIAIAIQFSLYVNANAEDLRKLFVNFEGKKDLEVKFTVPVDQVPIDEFIKKIVTLISENINPSIYDWISPNFTTTTQNDKLTTGVALMTTLKNYFNYDLVSVFCGIPQVTILGSIDDWRQIRERVYRLKEFEQDGKSVMVKWSTMLDRILTEFVSVKGGKQPDKKFWEEAIRIDYRMVDSECSSFNETVLNGWITAFSVFHRTGKWQGDSESNESKNDWASISTEDITPGLVSVPVRIFDEYAGVGERNYTGAVITGHMGYSVKEDEITIQPMSGWAMVITNNAPKYLKKFRKNSQSKKPVLKH